MALVDNMSVGKDSATSEMRDSMYKSMYMNDPSKLVNNNMLQFNLNMEPLAEILTSVIDAQKMNKTRVDSLVADNLSMKKRLDEYEEKFVFIDTKIGKVIGMLS